MLNLCNSQKPLSPVYQLSLIEFVITFSKYQVTIQQAQKLQKKSFPIPFSKITCFWECEKTLSLIFWSMISFNILKFSGTQNIVSWISGMENHVGEQTVNIFGKVFPKDAFICRLYYLAFFASFGSLFPLLAVYFKQLGMTAAQVCFTLFEVFVWTPWRESAPKNRHVIFPGWIPNRSPSNRWIPVWPILESIRKQIQVSLWSLVLLMMMADHFLCRHILAHVI